LCCRQNDEHISRKTTPLREEEDFSVQNDRTKRQYLREEGPEAGGKKVEGMGGRANCPQRSSRGSSEKAT